MKIFKCGINQALKLEGGIELRYLGIDESGETYKSGTYKIGVKAPKHVDIKRETMFLSDCEIILNDNFNEVNGNF